MAFASEAVNVRPELSLPELSGPSSPRPMSTPATLKLLVVKLARKLWPPSPEPPLPEPPPAPPPKPPPLTLTAGTVPLIVRLSRVSPPAAAATPCRLATVATDDELIEASVGLAESVLLLILVPATGRDPVPARKPKPNDPGLNDPAFGVLVTVTSVPTPYSACSTVPWAFLTPADAAVTVITRPTPSGEAERDEDGLAHAAAKLTPQIGEEHPVLL